jgi:hypothetical protein
MAGRNGQARFLAAVLAGVRYEPTTTFSEVNGLDASLCKLTDAQIGTGNPIYQNGAHQTAISFRVPPRVARVCRRAKGWAPRTYISIRAPLRLNPPDFWGAKAGISSAVLALLPSIVPSSKTRQSNSLERPESWNSGPNSLTS